MAEMHVGQRALPECRARADRSYRFLPSVTLHSRASFSFTQAYFVSHVKK